MTDTLCGRQSLRRGMHIACRQAVAWRGWGLCAMNDARLEASFELDLDLGVEEAIVTGPQGNHASHST